MSKERLKEFEDTIKKYIAFRFQKFLPESSVIILNNNSYSESYADKDIDENEVKSLTVRNMLYDIIDITCPLSVEVSDGVFKDVIYGEHLENGIIEFYALEISKEVGFDYKIDPDVKEDLKMALDIYNVLDNKLDYMTFKSNAIEILEAANIDDIIDRNDDLALEEYVNNVALSKGIAEELPTQEKEKEEKKEELKKVETGSKEEIDQMNKEFAVDGVLQIIYANGKRKVKYTDEFNVTHLLNVDDTYALSEIYRREFARTKSGEKIDSKKVFNELKDRFGELSLDDELDERKINQDKIRTKEFVEQSDKFKDKIDEGKVTFDEEAKIFVLPKTKEVVETEVKGEKVEATITGKENENIATLGPDDINPVKDTSSVEDKALTEKDVQKIIEQAENSELSLDKLRELKNALISEAKQEGNEKEAERIAEEVDQEKLKEINSELRDKGPQLKRKSAYVNKALLFFIFCVVVSISIIIGVTLAYFS